MRRRDGSGCPRYLARPGLSGGPPRLAWGRARTPHRPPAPRRGQAAAGGPGAGRMSPVFLELHPDEGGTLIVDVLDVSRVGPAHGAAKGCSVLFKGDHKTVGFKDDITVI